MLLVTIEKMMSNRRWCQDRRWFQNKDDEIIDSVKYSYIGDEYENLIGKVLKFGLMDCDLQLTNSDNQKLGLTKIVN